MGGGGGAACDTDTLDYESFIVNDEGGGFFDLLLFLVFNIGGYKFISTGPYRDHYLGYDFSVGAGGGGGEEVTTDPRWRWVVSVSVSAIKMIKIFRKPMEWTGIVVEFILNFLSHNDKLMCRILRGDVEIPKRDSETFISAIGHLDGRIDLFKSSKLDHNFEGQVKMEDRALMDLCIMSSKLAYENRLVVGNIVHFHWKMHHVDFYDGWNDYQKLYSTQVFIMCDKAEDANLVVISFRGTEPFNADDWVTDFDVSLHAIDPEKKKQVHVGFLEALGLGNRLKTSTIQMHLQDQVENGVDGKKPAPAPNMVKDSAYYLVRRKLKELLKKHKKAKFVVTGHSLGGALAILFPTVLMLHDEEALLQRLLGVYTFGQPRVCNRELGNDVADRLKRYGTSYYRVVYCNDVVPRLPYDDKICKYKHFGMCLYYNSLYIQQKMVEEPNKNYFGLLYVIPHYATAVWEMMRSLVMKYLYGPDYAESWAAFLWRLVGLVMPGCSAHSPLNYVNSIRLGLYYGQRFHD